MTTLSYFTYNIIEPYLLFNNSFYGCLELSLICKKSFKNVQNYILYQANLIKFYPNINYFIYYLYNIKIDNKNHIFNYSLIDEAIKNDSLSNGCYDLKLIQYKDIENLYCIDTWGYYGAKENNIKNKINLIRKCTKLNKVYIQSYFSVNSLEQDPTCDGFYQFENLNLYWDPDEAPESFYDECDDDYYTFNYSFDFLKRYSSIRKIKIFTVANEANMHLDKLNNIILKGGDLIEKIDFKYHNTPYNFIVKLLNSTNNNITSLSVRLGNFSINFNEEVDENDQDEQLQSFNTSDWVFILFSKYINVVFNNKIKKLLIRKNVDLFSSPNNNNPKPFLESINKNSSIGVLGLELFNLVQDQSFKLLSPLTTMSNINTLYCNLESLNQFLQHCNENLNIETLKVAVDKYSSNQSIDNLHEILSSFFYLNNSKLKYLYLYNDHFDQNIKDLIIDSLNKSKNNITIKFLNYNN